MMSNSHEPTSAMPDYQLMATDIEEMQLLISVSELHGIMCGYICAGAYKPAELWLRTLLVQCKSKVSQSASARLFELFAITQHLIDAMDFSFCLFLPDDDAPIDSRAKAFAEWCEGFTQGLTMNDISGDQFKDTESKDALTHIFEFAQLDCDSISVSEADEMALTEVSEYTRLGVLRLHGDLVMQHGQKRQDERKKH